MTITLILYPVAVVTQIAGYLAMKSQDPGGEKGYLRALISGLGILGVSAVFALLVYYL